MIKIRMLSGVKSKGKQNKRLMTQETEAAMARYLHRLQKKSTNSIIMVNRIDNAEN